MRSAAVAAPKQSATAIAARALMHAAASTRSGRDVVKGHRGAVAGRQAPGSSKPWRRSSWEAVHDVEETLERLVESYGSCEWCETVIPPEQREVIPLGRLCRVCRRR